MSFRKAPTRVSATIGGKEIILETGRVATQAHGSVTIQCGGTVVLVTVCSQPLDFDRGFFPLTVEYSERMYAAGRIPGSFFRREIGRPSERETLVSRLIDRPIRPLFPKGLPEDVQVLASVISSDQENESDVLSITAASAAVMLSPLPFAEAVAGGRIGRINGQFILNPTVKEMAESDLNIVFAASADALVMVEGEATFVPEDVIIDALEWGRKEIQPLIEAQVKLRELAGKAKMAFTPQEDDAALLARIEELAAGAGLEAAMRVPEKMARKDARKLVKEKIVEALKADPTYGEDEKALSSVGDIIGHIEKKVVRKRILDEGTRIDGRDTRTVRPIEIRQSVLPRTHGSALFTRGETQSLTSVTLGTKLDEKVKDEVLVQGTEQFVLHYNFPPFSTGEAKAARGLSRREIGHGHLAWRALKPMIPLGEENPYAVRVVSDILESNGSSSMATVCAGTLALMDAGVKLKKPVSGIAMGLISDSQSGKWAVLSDILGDEDHLGDMDFKVTGTKDGITATQMDIKVDGLSYEVLAAALEQARKGRLHILDKITECIAEPREDYKPFVPRIVQITIPQDMIGAVIGPGGKVIQDIQKTTGTTITITEVDNKGIVDIFGQDKTALDGALNRIKAIVAIPEIGETYHGKIRSIVTFGAFVEIMPGKDALLHISEIDYKRFETMEETGLKEGDEIDVKLIGMDPKTNKLKLSRKVLLPKPEGYVERERRPRGERPERGERHERHGRPERKEE